MPTQVYYVGMANATDAAMRAERCAIARSLTVVGEKWSLLVVREAALGTSRFSEFKERLGVASDVLTDRLAKLVDAGVLTRIAYRDDGARERYRYALTGDGDELMVVLGALAAWGDAHVPCELGSAHEFVEASTGRPVRVGFVADDGRALDPGDIRLVRRQPVAV
jgi:DNA-binding HxlR family transcriptional regulator